MKQKNLTIALVFLVTSFFACEETNKIFLPENITVTPGETKAVILTKAGWQEFEKGNFSNAVDSFRLAIAEDYFYNDAYNGLGWALSRMDSLPIAQKNFTIAIISSNTPLEIYKDASAGRAFVNLALDEYNDAIADVNNAITSRQYPYYSEYTFRHDINITELDLLLVKAECYFLLEDYYNCYNTLLIIDDTLVVDQNNPEQLAEIIENLKTLI